LVTLDVLAASLSLVASRRRFDDVDVVGEHLIGDRRIASNSVVIARRWWHPQHASAFKTA
jgi:dihydroorotase